MTSLSGNAASNPLLSNTQARDMASLLHPFTNLTLLRQTGPTVIQRGAGVFVYGADGKDYLEAMGGLWCTALGWGEEELAETAAAQMRKLSFQHVFGGKSHEPAIELAETLKELSPFPVGKVFFANSGSEANDSQIKFMWYAANARGQTGRKKIIARDKAYHGVTLAAASLTGLDAFHKSFDLPFDFTVRADCPHHYRRAEPGESEEAFSARLADRLEAQIQHEGPDTIAAMFVEAVMGAGGAITPPKGYFEAITRVLARYDIPLVDDEVICGFGRTGNWFGCETFNYQPDSMSIAKALSSAYIPISAVMLSPELTDIIEQEATRIGGLWHAFTYSAHPVAAAVALKTIEIYRRRDIVGHVRAVSSVFQQRLTALADHPLVGEARGVGLIGGIELVADKKTRRNFEPGKLVALTCGRLCEEEGLIVRPLAGDRIAFCPPLVISEAEVGELFDRFGRALARTLDWVKAEGLIA
ncbi:MAG: aminotransferase class III-fold pyridoxal phosphate-dependent enzyme [Alphaproteobacteria bacterium]|nr:aminotransferase class III-fold pyridoxal phosphate-dependent enzyme [Alphaproteobacteria bacterium]